MAVIVGLLIAVPFLGFVAYAIVPGRTPDLDRILLAWIPALIALAGGAVLVSATGRRRPLTRSRLVAAIAGTIALWEGIVVALSIVLAQWQPAYALANIALNALWVLLWIPVKLRRFGGETAVEIRAPRSRVFAFVAAPSNWPQFDEDAVSVQIRPPSELRAGSEIVEIRRYDAAVRGPRMLPDTVETVAVVTQLVPDQAIATRAAAGASTAEYVFSETAAGTSVTIKAQVTIPYAAAVIGAVLGFAAQRPARQAKAKRSLARLKELLEQP